MDSRRGRLHRCRCAICPLGPHHDGIAPVECAFARRAYPKDAKPTDVGVAAVGTPPRRSKRSERSDVARVHDVLPGRQFLGDAQEPIKYRACNELAYFVEATSPQGDSAGRKAHELCAHTHCETALSALKPARNEVTGLSDPTARFETQSRSLLARIRLPVVRNHCVATHTCVQFSRGHTPCGDPPPWARCATSLRRHVCAVGLSAGIAVAACIAEGLCESHGYFLGSQ